MNKSIKILGVMGLTLGVGLLAWRYTPVGKKVLSTWVLSTWKAMKKGKGSSFDTKGLEKALTNLDYGSHQLLFRLTLLDPMSGNDVPDSKVESFKRLLGRLKEKGVFMNPAFDALNGIIFPT